MKLTSAIFLILSALLTFTHGAAAGPTVQDRDVVVIDNIEYKLDAPLLGQLDSTTYVAMQEKLDFRSAVFSWNFRGHVATFEAKDQMLYLKSIRTSSEHTDFKDLLDRYIDRKGRVLASWVSGKFICGTGRCLYAAGNGFDSVYEREKELVVENGIIVSSRSFTNKAQGIMTLDDVKSRISSDFDLSNIPAPAGRITVKVDAAEFCATGKVTRWRVELLRSHENLPESTKQMLIAEVNRVFMATKAQDGNVTLGIRAGHNTIHGGFAAVSLEAEHALKRHFSINGGIQYSTVGKTAAEVCPAYFHDFNWGRLSAEALLHYSNMYSINNLATGAGLALDTKWIFCRLGYYYRAYGESVYWVKEPFNIYYTFGVSCLPNVPEWDLKLYATNCERFEMERHYHPSLVIQSWFYPGEHLGITLGVNYKPAGMLHLSTDYYQVYTKAGICYRW